ncbi:MAG: hypothetical protein AB7S61_09190 [Methanoregulaceae archaeon]
MRYYERAIAGKPEQGQISDCCELSSLVNPTEKNDRPYEDECYGADVMTETSTSCHVSRSAPEKCRGPAVRDRFKDFFETEEMKYIKITGNIEKGGEENAE